MKLTEAFAAVNIYSGAIEVTTVSERAKDARSEVLDWDEAKEFGWRIRRVLIVVDTEAARRALAEQDGSNRE